MDQTVVTLLIATCGAAIGVGAIAGGYLAVQAAKRDADAAIRAAMQATRPNGETTRPDAAAVRAAIAAPRPAAAAPRSAVAVGRPAAAAPRSAVAIRRPRAAKPPVQDATMTPEQREMRVVELQRTRAILLGLLNVLEALAFGEASKATAARAVLGDVSDCNISLVGDVSVVSTYLLTAEMLRNQVGQGLPVDAVVEVASLRVKLLNALAQQEGRLSRGEEPLIIEPVGNPDFFSDELMTPRRRATPSRRRA